VQLLVLIGWLQQQLGQPLRRPGRAVKAVQVGPQPRDQRVERLALHQHGARRADLCVGGGPCRRAGWSRVGDRRRQRADAESAASTATPGACGPMLRRSKAVARPSRRRHASAGRAASAPTHLDAAALLKPPKLQLQEVLQQGPQQRPGVSGGRAVRRGSLGRACAAVLGVRARRPETLAMPPPRLAAHRMIPVSAISATTPRSGSVNSRRSAGHLSAGARAARGSAHACFEHKATSSGRAACAALLSSPAAARLHTAAQRTRARRPPAGAS
jgi:hypothetical protein